MKILFIVGVHGEEYKPVQAVKELNIPFLIANEKALAKGVRFIDENLNRCFPGNSETHEGGLAQKICEKMQAYDCVIDIHTTISPTDPFVIVTNETCLSKYVALPKVVVMGARIADGKALIDFHPNAVSLEFAHTVSVEEIKGVILETLANIHDKVVVKQEVFEVYDFITEDLGIVGSFEYVQDFYAIMHGKGPYKNKFGYKGRQM
jgi:hypothetical protein